MDEIELVVWFKEEKGYMKTVIKPSFSTNREYFMKLKMKVDIEIESIKQHILSLYDDPKKANLKKPIHEDHNKQEIIDKLVLIKRDNIRTREVLKGMLADGDFIICDWCKSKMYKIPVNVSYTRYGNSYIIHDIGVNNEVKYIFGCNNNSCVNAIEEDVYIQTMRWLQLREELIAKGEKFVPNKFGYWNWII